MKKSLYILFALLLTLGWGCNESPEQSGMESSDSEETTGSSSESANQLTITSPNTGEVLQVAPQNLTGSNWNDAVNACNSMGDGWRLPTKEELQVMYKEIHQKGKGDFDPEWYWSSSENGDDDAWYVAFENGFSGSNGKSLQNQVRPVRPME